MRAIKIDVLRNEIYYVGISTKKMLDDIHNIINCDTVNKVNIEEFGNNHLLIDENGNTNGNWSSRFSFVSGNFKDRIFYGNAILIGVINGQWVNTNLDINNVKESITFCSFF